MLVSLQTCFRKQRPHAVKLQKEREREKKKQLKSTIEVVQTNGVLYFKSSEVSYSLLSLYIVCGRHKLFLFSENP